MHFLKKKNRPYTCAKSDNICKFKLRGVIQKTVFFKFSELSMGGGGSLAPKTRRFPEEKKRCLRRNNGKKESDEKRVRNWATGPAVQETARCKLGGAQLTPGTEIPSSVHKDKSREGRMPEIRANNRKPPLTRLGKPKAERRGG